MIVIPRLEITDARFTSSSVAEPDTSETAWVSGGTYAVGDLRIRASTHRVYECTVAVTGSTTPPETDTAHWRDDGPTNKWAMVDLERSSQTVVAGGSIVAVFTPGKRVNAIGLVGLWGASVRVQMHVGGSPVYDTTTSLQLRYTTTWSQYFYGEFRTRSSMVLFDLPLSASGVITVTIEPTAGEAKCGGVVLGTAEDLGVIVDEPASDVNNFSKVTRDDFGNATLIKRRNVPVLRHRVRADAARLDRLRALRDDLDAVPALFSGLDNRNTSVFFDTLLVLGIVKKWTIGLRAQAVVSDIELEEL